MEGKLLNEKDDFDFAKTLARQIVMGMPTPLSIEDITNAAETAIGVAKTLGKNGPYDMERFLRDLRASCVVHFKDDITVLVDRGHQKWLNSPRAVDLSWAFWERYKDWLLRIEEFPPEPLRKLDEHSDYILDLLQDPESPGPWSRRGLVVGQVQSGKTMNYTALINKAADSGYRLIIVLAGLWENLRYQTQERLSEGFLGKESKAFELNDDSRVGVGLIRPLPRAWCGTSMKNDFSKVKMDFGAVLGKENPLPCLLVVKKNKSILNNVRKWILDSSKVEKDEHGNDIIKDVPLLIIDDEADHASINTKEVPVDDDDKVIEEHNPTAINAGIRQLLSMFEKNAYVGYTATPFANVFIRHDAKAKNVGDDLFPRSFIVNLPAPSNYVGAAQLFGFDEDDPYRLTEHIRPKVIQSVEDYRDWMPDKHKNGYEPGTVIPDTLKRAIKSFVLVCAARIVRGQQDKHNTMLIHVTRFKSVQDEVASQVKQELAMIQRRLKYSDGDSPDQIHTEMRKIWEEDFVPVSDSFGETPISYDDLLPHMKTAAGQISRPKVINGEAKDVLDYKKGTVHAIVIGGNKLSRGLTLEGLSISYYLRATVMYDTLLQMGRWFGYRNGYRDLCKLYTTDELVEWYGHVARVDAELRAEFDIMDDLGKEPIDYGLKVQCHSGALLITAVNKMQAGTPMRLSYDGGLSETVTFIPAAINDNFEQTVRFVNACDSARGPARKGSKGDGLGRYIWENVPGDIVADYISRMQVHKDAVTVVPTYLAQYIERQLRRGELTDWMVVLVANGDGAPFAIGNYTDVNLSKRNPSERQKSTSTKYAIGRLMNPPDEFLDLENQDELVPPGTKHRPEKLRAKRDPKKGMLVIYPIDQKGRTDKPIIGFGLSFPASENADKVEYRVNKLFAEQISGRA